MTAPEKGFTLLEIMVALTVLAIVLASVFKLQSSTASLAEAGYFKSAAPLLASTKLVELAQDNFDDQENLTGDFEGEFEGYSWACSIQSGTESGDWEDILGKERTEQFKRIHLTIYGQDKNRQFTITAWRFVNAEE